MKKSRLLLSLLFVALPCGSALAGNVYKWTDENGVVHYTDQKPREQAAEQMNIRTTQGGSGASSNTGSEYLNGAMDDLKRQQEIQDLGKRQADEEAQEKQRKKELCESARKNLEVIQNNARIKIDDNGSQRYLTPEEILEKRDSFEKIAKENCQ